MKLTLEKKIPIIIFAMLLTIVGIFLFTLDTSKVLGNVSRVSPSCTTSASVTGTLSNGASITLGAPSSATSSPNFISTGVSTSTLNCDMYDAGQQTLSDMASIKVQLAASSTSSVLNMDVQFSQDGLDWYAVSQLGMSEVNTSTSTPDISPVQQFKFTFASSTINRAVVSNANSATSSRIFLTETPTRYMRIIFTAPVGSAASAYWAEIRGQKQQQSN